MAGRRGAICDLRVAKAARQAISGGRCETGGNGTDTERMNFHKQRNIRVDEGLDLRRRGGPSDAKNCQEGVWW